MRRRDKSDSGGKKRSARTRFIVITTKTRYATICSDVQRCEFSAHRSQYAAKQDDVTAESAVNTLAFLRARERKRERERRGGRKKERSMSYRSHRAYRSFTVHLSRERRLGMRCLVLCQSRTIKISRGISLRARCETHNGSNISAAYIRTTVDSISPSLIE